MVIRSKEKEVKDKKDYQAVDTIHMTRNNKLSIKTIIKTDKKRLKSKSNSIYSKLKTDNQTRPIYRHTTSKAMASQHSRLHDIQCNNPKVI